MNEQKKRIRDFMKSKNITQLQLGNDIGMTQSGISSLLNGDVSVQKSHALLFQSVYNLSPDWLLHGTEPMYLPHENKYTDDKQREVNEVYEIMPPPGKEVIHGVAIEQKKKFEAEKRKSNIERIDVEFIMLPVLGTIPAGAPKIVESDTGEEMPVPVMKMRKGYVYYLLKVEGDSMIECGIHEGDIVIMEKRENPENGKICAVRVDGEHTLKRFRYNITTETISLIPCNPDYEIKQYPKNTVTVEGVMIGKMNFGY